MKRFNFLPMALIASLVVVAVSCSVPRSVSDEYYDDYPSGGSVYYSVPYGNAPIMLQRDPFTGRYYEVVPYGSRVYPPVTRYGYGYGNGNRRNYSNDRDNDRNNRYNDRDRDRDRNNYNSKPRGNYYNNDNRNRDTYNNNRYNNANKETDAQRQKSREEARNKVLGNNH